MCLFKDLFKTEEGVIWSTYNSLTNQEYHRNTYRMFINFLDEHPRFKNAEIIGTGRQEFHIWPFYNYSDINDEELWKVTLKGKFYAIGINRPWYHKTYRTKTKFVFRRYYPEGEQKIRRKKKQVAINRIDIKTSTKYKYSFKNDCQIRALAALTGRDYFQIYEDMKERGWAPEKAGSVMAATGFTKNRWDEVLELYGYKKEIVWEKFTPDKNQIFKGVTGITVKTVSKRLPKGKYAILIRGHVLALIDGQLFDGWDSQNTRCIRILKITEL